jgi:virginiamycin B lyase
MRPLAVMLVIVSLGCAHQPVANPSTTAAAADLSASVELEEFRIPRDGAFPHDPASGHDGMLWFTEQKGNAIGRFDPFLHTFAEFPIPTADSGPHGIAVDAQGDVWFTAESRGYIGRLDPDAGAVHEWPMPDPRASDPHSLAFAPSGVLFFTVQRGGFVGRLDPRTNKIDLRELRAGSLPYGIAIGKDGAAYFCEFGANRIGRLDPTSLEIREYTLPEGARPRRIAVANDGALHYTDVARAKHARLDPQSALVREWSTRPQPYAIAITPDDLVWFVETGVSPNTLVRFDPKTEQSLSMPIPSGGGIVRNMVATPDGRLYLAESAANRIAVATPR